MFDDISEVPRFGVRDAASRHLRKFTVKSACFSLRFYTALHLTSWAVPSDLPYEASISTAKTIARFQKSGGTSFYPIQLSEMSPISLELPLFVAASIRASVRDKACNVQKTKMKYIHKISAISNRFMSHISRR